MADSKITALAALTAADPVNDMFPVVDVSDTSMAASGTTKRISVNNILSSSPTASGALTVTGLVTAGSATITGDLTVRTNKLLVTATGVGVGAAPVNPFDVVSTAGTLSVFKRTGSNGAFIGIEDGSGTGLAYLGFTNGTFSIQTPGSGYADKYTIASDGTATWSVAGTTAMTLNSTGLGLGVSPVTALSFPIGTTKIVAQSAVTAHLAGNAGTMKFGISDGGGDYSGMHVVNSHGGTYSSQDLLFFTGEGGVTLSLERMRITRSGDLILQAPSTPPTLTVNGQLTVNATSNTNLRFSYRGSDGTTRVANLTLA